MTEPVDVLALGAHPDDIELGCGAALVVAARSGLRVAAADLSRGEMASFGTVEERDLERMEAARVLGLCARPCLDLPDTRIGSDAGHLDAVVSLLRDLRPRVVLAPYLDDRHPDHAATGRLARDATFAAGLARVGPGNAFRPRHLFHYMVHHPFSPSFVVDVTETWPVKMAALAAHASQFGTAGSPSAPGLLAAVEARAVWHGAMIGAARGEAFWAAGPVPLPNLPGLDRPGRGSTVGGYKAFL
ncbi:MAG: bacillithiol biosynthesis deacetylase BshB1 [Acidimicrobiales bacterium]